MRATLRVFTRTTPSGLVAVVQVDDREFWFGALNEAREFAGLVLCWIHGLPPRDGDSWERYASRCV